MTAPDTAPAVGAAAPAALTLVSANLRAGGVGRSRTETRLPALLDHLADLRADVLACQELLSFDEHDRRLLHQAEQRLGMAGVLGISVQTGMHTGVFVRPPLRIAESRVSSGGIWHHSVTHTLIAWDEHDSVRAGRLRVASVHLHPRNPARRLLEAGELTDYAASPAPALLLGDFNTEDAHTDLSTAPGHVAARFARLGTRVPDTDPLDLLRSAGMSDLAQAVAGPGGVPARTTGHWPGASVRGRPDRALGNPAAAVALLDVRIATAARMVTDHDWPIVRLDTAALATGTPEPARTVGAHP